MNTSRQRCQHDSCNCRPTDFLPYRRESEEKANKKRGAPAPTPLSTPSKETDNNPRYFQFLSQAQKNLFPNYSSTTKATLASIDDMESTKIYSFLGALSKILEKMGSIVAPINSERSAAFPKKIKG